MKPLLLIVLVVCLVACGVSTSRYQSLAEARADGHFERGWLPDVLPASATGIQAVNDLDLNTSLGAFQYRVGDDAAMLAAMRAGAPASAPFRDWAHVVRAKDRDGFLPWTYRASDATWVFFCDRGLGRCETWMWSGR